METKSEEAIFSTLKSQHLDSFYKITSQNQPRSARVLTAPERFCGRCAKHVLISSNYPKNHFMYIITSLKELEAIALPNKP